MAGILAHRPLAGKAPLAGGESVASLCDTLRAIRHQQITHGYVGSSMKIAIGSDHAGFEYKGKLLALLAYLGHEAIDYGAYSEESSDYPTWIRPVAEAVARGDVDRGIVLGGSGNGEAIVANRVPGVRCTLCWNADSARFGREHNDSNVLSMGQRLVSWETAREIVDVWLTTEFEGGRHLRRINQIDGEPQRLT